MERCKICGETSETKEIVLLKTDFGEILACLDCVKKLAEEARAEEKKHLHQKASNKVIGLTPKEIKERLDEVVIGQEHAKKMLATEVYKHFLRINNKTKLAKQGKKIKKSNILLTGLSGTGKTLLAKTLADILNVPVYIGDATTLTEAGYVGEDVENLLRGLIQNSDNNIDLAEKGIIYIDEIDKIAKKGENISITRDVSGEGVQQALLKITEGTVARVPMQGGRKHPLQEMYEINTEDVLFIAGGAFVGIEDYVKERMKSKSDSSIGFLAKPIVPQTANEEIRNLRQNITQEDLKRYGIIPEFLGRFPKLSNLEPLNTSDLIQIMKESKTSVLLEYKTLFKLEGRNLEFTDGAIRKIAETAMQKGLGARGIQSIIEDIMLEVVYEMPSENKKKYLITEEFLSQAGDLMQNIA